MSTRWIGRMTRLAGDRSTEYLLCGEKYIDYLAIIDEDEKGYFYPRLHKVLSDKTLGKDELMTAWATNLASAKKMICMDNGWKSKDFIWEKEEI